MTLRMRIEAIYILWKDMREKQGPNWFSQKVSAAKKATPLSH